MSMQSWLDEFYPVPARDPSAISDDIAACNHSIRKWSGLTQWNMQRHNVSLASRVVSDGSSHLTLGIDSSSCALCVRHYDALPLPNSSCATCPLARARGGVPCDSVMEGERTSPFMAGVAGSPTPMLTWLRRALALAHADAWSARVRDRA